MERLRELRKKASLSQSELAEKIGVSLFTIFRWEQGRTSPNGDELLLLSKELNTTPNYLLGVGRGEK